MVKPSLLQDWDATIAPRVVSIWAGDEIPVASRPKKSSATLARRTPTISLCYKSHAVFVTWTSPKSISLATTGSVTSDDVRLANLQRDLKPIAAHIQSR